MAGAVLTTRPVIAASIFVFAWTTVIFRNPAGPPWRETMLVLEALGGTTLRSRLRAGGAPAPDGAALLALLDRLPVGVAVYHLADASDDAWRRIRSNLRGKVSRVAGRALDSMSRSTLYGVVEDVLGEPVEPS